MGDFVYGDRGGLLPNEGGAGGGRKRKRWGLKPKEKRVKRGGREEGDTVTLGH